MKKSILTISSIMAIGLMSANISAQDNSNDTRGEIGYSKGALGYDAIIDGDYEKALNQLESADKVSENDPARLINLAQVYKKMGRYNEAAAILTQVTEAPRDIDLILSTGQVVSSKEIAKIQLSKLQTAIASR